MTSHDVGIAYPKWYKKTRKRANPIVLSIAVWKGLDLVEK